MKVKILVLAVAMMLVAATVQAGLWDPAVLNSSFEAPVLNAGGGAGSWGQAVDDWFGSSYWGTFIEHEGDGTPGIPLTPYGDNWGGVSGADQYMYQDIGTYEEGLDIAVSLLVGQRLNNPFGSIQINLWVGGDKTVLDDYDPGDPGVHYSLTEVGATQIDSSGDLTPVFPGDGTPMGTAPVATSLSTGTGYTPGDTLWLEFYQVAGKSYLDNVVVVPEPATLILLGLGGLCLRRRRT